MGLEFCPGGDLFEAISRKTRSGKLIKKKHIQFFGGCLVLAIEYIHSMGIIHKDIKSENIVISKHGYPKLTDFGSSFNQNDKGNYDISRDVTPEIKAPETIIDNT